MTTQPPAEGFETKDYPGAIPGRPGYQLADQPLPEHGPDGIQPGYSNSEGREGDDGASVFDTAGGGSTSGTTETTTETTGGDGATEGGDSTKGDGTSTSTSGSGTKRASTTTKSSTSK